MQNSHQTTEWDDALQRFGIVAPQKHEKEVHEDSIIQMVEDTVKERTSFEPKLENATLDELDEFEDEEDERVLLQYRQKRLQEMKEHALKSKFGEVLEITAQDYVEEVNKAGADVWVVLHLYERGIPFCALINQHMASLAKKFPKTKFIKSIASLCIKDFPAAHLPTIFVYHEGVMKSKFVGQKDLGGGNHFTAEAFELLLAKAGALVTNLQPEVKKEVTNVMFSSLRSVQNCRQDSSSDTDGE